MTLLGIDLGGTKVALRAVGDRGVHEDVFTWPVAGGLAADLEALTGAVRALLARAGGAVRSAGVALPATVDGHGRISAWPNRPSWIGLDVPRTLAALVPGAAVQWGDDGDVAAVAESRHTGCGDLLYVGVGTGIGGGLVLGGRMVPGPALGSFELGHLPVRPAGPRCRCGRQGCLQAVASGPATLARAAALRRRAVPAEEFVGAFAAAEPWAVTALRDGTDAVALAVVGVSELLHPALVAVGGGFAGAVPGYAGLVAEQVARLARTGQPPAAVVAAAVPNPSLRGALLLAEDAAALSPMI
ncbi:ROK family protein [Dactylosporangium sp. CA-152071]|uniref:ROK family protein n=1 Tax=Dactylosporangium sp. CA-152071 TaxID=3239933 RepID=UPI003D8B857C